MVESSMNSAERKVDWSKPIEAVHVDGRVAPAEFLKFSSTGDSAFVHCQETEGYGNWWYDVREPGYVWQGWSIRNVAQSAKTTIDPALVERMVALVRRVASDEPGGRDRYRTDAKALIAEMVPASVQRFQSAHKDWPLLDRAELIERVLAWKETNA